MKEARHNSVILVEDILHILGNKLEVAIGANIGGHVGFHGLFFNVEVNFLCGAQATICKFNRYCCARRAITQLIPIVGEADVAAECINAEQIGIVTRQAPTNSVTIRVF